MSDPSYKNILVSFQVVSKLQHTLNANIQLIWLGSNEELCAKYSKRLNLINSAIPIRNLHFNSLVELYNSVDCLLFPSLYEGFGSPPLEAMNAGCPVVSVKISSIPEVAGDAAILIDKIKKENFIHAVKLLNNKKFKTKLVNKGFAQAVKNILENENLRNNYIELGYRNANRFTWESSSLKVFSLYQKILNKKF